jgi:hypothetical protein
MLVYEFFEKDPDYERIYEILTTDHTWATAKSKEFGIPYKTWLAEIVTKPLETKEENVDAGYCWCNGDVQGWVKLLSEII